jgi:hypothetical protein
LGSKVLDKEEPVEGWEPLPWQPGRARRKRSRKGRGMRRRLFRRILKFKPKFQLKVEGAGGGPGDVIEEGSATFL